VPGEVSGELDGHLLKSDRRFEDALVGRIEPVDRVLLLVLDKPQPSERLLEAAVGTHARETMREDARLDFDAVHQDDATARKGVYFLLAKRWLRHFLPGSRLLFERCSFFGEWVHGLTPAWWWNHATKP
jgi:hypothetical protein